MTTRIDRLTRRRFLSASAAATAFSIVMPAAVRGTAANSRVKVGCVGLGGRGDMIANMFAEHGGYQMAGLCDYFPSIVRSAGKRLDVPEDKYFSTLSGYKRLIDSGIEAIVLKVPPCFFPEQATAAVKAGIHVYVAKPVAIDVPGTLQMLRMGELATDNKQVFLVDFQMRVNPYLIECIKLLRKGIIGDIRFIRSFYDDDAFPDPPLTENIESRLRRLVWVNDIALGGGKLVNSGVHSIDTALWIADRLPVSATGSSIFARKDPHGDSRDVYSITYRFEGDDLLLSHTGEHFHNLNSRIAHCDAFGPYGYLEARYTEKNWIRSEREGFGGGYAGGEQPDIYRFGPRQNIDTFHKSITTGIYDNPTVIPSVNANLACILGKEAAERNTTITWDQIIEENKAITPDLTGLRE